MLNANELLNTPKRYFSKSRELVWFGVLDSRLVEADLLLASSTPSFGTNDKPARMTDGDVDAVFCYVSSWNEPKAFDPYVNFTLQQSMRVQQVKVLLRNHINDIYCEYSQLKIQGD